MQGVNKGKRNGFFLPGREKLLGCAWIRAGKEASPSATPAGNTEIAPTPTGLHDESINPKGEGVNERRRGYISTYHRKVLIGNQARGPAVFTQDMRLCSWLPLDFRAAVRYLIRRWVAKRFGRVRDAFGFS